jgi:predicted phosphodiesterase
VLAGVIRIIHAGDIVDPDVLTALESVAPVVAVAGSVETPELSERLPREVTGVVGEISYAVGHKRKRLMKTAGGRRSRRRERRASGFGRLRSRTRPQHLLGGWHALPEPRQRERAT